MMASKHCSPIILAFSLTLFAVIDLSFGQIDEDELERLLNPVGMDSLETSTTVVDSNAAVEQREEMVRVTAGNFIMGSNDFEIDERPEREVFVSEFWIDKYPVTNSQFSLFLNELVESYPNDSSKIEQFILLAKAETKIQKVGGRFVAVENYGQHPVINVTWFGAERFARFYDKRLPTEAEWEKAARGFSGLRYPWGNEIDSSRANYWDSRDPFNDETTPVGFYNGQNYHGFVTSDSPSPFGAYDLGANVKEWVADWYRYNYYSESKIVDPPGPDTGSKKVVRGGGYLFRVENQRASQRYALEPDRATSFIGFRCARSTAPEEK